MIGRLLASVAAIFGSLLAGGMLFIRVVMVPIWQRMPPSEFQGWYRPYSPATGKLMRPLGGVSAVAATASAAAQVMARDGARGSSATAAVAAIGIAVITVKVNEPANERFVEGNLSDDETKAVLNRWVRAHEARVALGLLGTVAAVRTLASRW